MREPTDIRAMNVQNGAGTHDTEKQEDISSDDGHVRTGNLWTATAHVITAVIGAGVLSLPWSVAQLGWLLGTPILLAFSWVTYYTAVLLTECYRSPHPVTGSRNYKYKDAVKAILGGYKVSLCMWAQYSNLYGCLIGYTITAATSMMAIKKAQCFHEEGKDAPCQISGNPYMIIFGVSELILSQLPSLEEISWVSVVAAIMSFAYSSIGLGLSIAKVAGRKHLSGTLMGVPVAELSPAKKTWYIFQALGNIAFSYSFSTVLIEIQDTLKSPPPENKTMKKATTMGLSVTTVFYMSIGLIGYGAFGNSAPGNMLTGFGFYEPFWLIDIGNLCIAIHIVGAYQVFAQPVFAIIEDWVGDKWKRSGFVHRIYTLKFPFCGSLRLTMCRLVLRSSIVVSTILIAMLMPFFNDIMGLIGSMAFWPLTVYFPVEMYIVQTSIKRWSPKWISLQCLSLVCFFVSLVAAIGSVAGITIALRHVSIFNMKY